LSSPHREALNQRNNKNRKEKNKKKITQQKIHPRKNISPAIFFETHSFFFSCFRTPLAEKRPKTHLKKKGEKKGTYVLFCELAQMYVVFSFYFFCRPLQQPVVHRVYARTLTEPRHSEGEPVRSVASDLAQAYSLLVAVALGLYLL
jgi:hypothetical protein